MNFDFFSTISASTLLLIVLNSSIYSFLFYFLRKFIQIGICLVPDEFRTVPRIPPHTNSNLSDFTLLIYAITVIMNIIIDKACDILIGPNIKLSVLNPSIIALANEYIIKYKYVI